MKFDLEVGPETRAMESDSLPPIGSVIFVEDRTGKISLLVYAHEQHVSGGDMRILVRTRKQLPAVPAPAPITAPTPAALPAEPMHWADKAFAMQDRLGR